MWHAFSLRLLFEAGRLVCFCERLCVRERERVKKFEHVWELVRDSARECVYMSEMVRESVCVFEFECECASERECVRLRESVYLSERERE